MRQAEHDRRVGAGHQGVPVARAVDVVTQRRERHDLPAAGAEALQRIACRVRGGAAVIDAGVLQRQAAEAHQQVGVLDDDVPLGGPLEQIVVGSDDPRHDHAGRAQAVGSAARERVSAKAIQESVHLALGVVEAARTRPAVRPAVDRLVAVAVDDPAQFTGQQFGEPLPADGDKVVGAAARALGPGPRRASRGAPRGR